MITLPDIMERLNEVLNDSNMRIGINEIKVSDLFILNLRHDISIIAKRIINHNFGSLEKEIGAKNTDDDNKNEDCKNYIKLNPYLAPDYKEPVKFSKKEKINISGGIFSLILNAEDKSEENFLYGLMDKVREL